MKIDVRSFCASIDERRVYELFVGLGYRQLVAFELARLCTWPAVQPIGRIDFGLPRRDHGPDYHYASLGSLPVGAPTSPTLSNLYMAPFDRELSMYCATHRLVYTRYADDVFVSSHDTRFSRSDAIAVAQYVRQQLSAVRLRANGAKTVIVPPGARKVVLGLLVNGDRPRLSPEFKKQMRMHYHFIERFGLAPHAEARNFPSVPMLERHLRGLIAYAGQIDPEYAAGLLERHTRLNWTYLA